MMNAARSVCGSTRPRPARLPVAWTQRCAVRRSVSADGDMGKVIDCNQVAPEAGCDHVVRGATEEEALRNAAEHAKEHGIVEVTPELMEKVKAAMHDE
jgi:predicted small metal-binding protein